MIQRNLPILLFSALFLLSFTVHAQTKKKWTEPVMVTEMNGGKIYVSYCTNSKDSIHYRIKSRCSGLKNIYTCFAFKYLDTNHIERQQMVRDISLAENIDQHYRIHAVYGISKITVPFLPETVIAYINDASDQPDIRQH